MRHAQKIPSCFGPLEILSYVEELRLGKIMAFMCVVTLVHVMLLLCQQTKISQPLPVLFPALALQRYLIMIFVIMIVIHQTFILT